MPVADDWSWHFGPVSLVPKWGVAEHGKMTWYGQGDATLSDPHWQLELPNGTIKRVPPGGIYHPAGIVANMYWKKPGIGPVPPSTPEQAAEDAAAGREWRNDRINTSYNWFWVDSTGERWSITFSPSGGDNFTFYARRVGAFGNVDPLIVSKVAVITEPANEALPAGFYAVAADERTLSIEDVSSSGAKAVLRFDRVAISPAPGSALADPLFTLSPAESFATGRSEFGHTEAQSQSLWVPVGFVTVTLSGTPATGEWSISASTLASRSQCRGARTYSATPGPVTRVHSFPQTTTYEIIGESNYEYTDVTHEERPDPPGPGPGWFFYYRAGAYGAQLHLTDRVIGARFDGESATPVLVKMDWEFDAWHDSATTTATASGRKTTRLTPSPGALISDTRLMTSGGASTHLRKLKITINAAGSPPAVFELSDSGSSSGYFEVQQNVYPPAVWNWTTSRTLKLGDQEYTVQPFMNTTGNIHTGAGIGLPPHVMADRVVYSSNDGYPNTLPEPLTDPAYAALAEWWMPVRGPSIVGPVLFPAATSGPVNEDHLYFAGWSPVLRRIGNKCHQVIARRRAQNFNGLEVEGTGWIVYLGEVAYPGGVVAEVPQAQTINSAPVWFHSFNPFNGSIASGKRPVNWV